MRRMKYFIRVLLGLLLSSSAFAQMPGIAPGWFINDVNKKAAWLPKEIRQRGLNEAIMARWNLLPLDIQLILHNSRIPAWMVPLIPNDPNRNEEIYKQLRFMRALAGPASASKIGARAEQLLIFGGAAQLPTPGDSVSGRGLGAQGCTAAMSKYVMAELMIEFPNDLENLSPQLGRSQSSSEMKALFYKAYNSGKSRLNIREVPFERLVNSDVPPGSLMIAQKPSGTHVFGWTRVPSAWRWSANNKMAIGNTGLPQFGDRMILAQEFLTDFPDEAYEARHNTHGPINSRQIVYRGRQADLSDPGTNVYAVRGSSFIIISFK